MLQHPVTLIWFKVDFVCIFYSDVDLELPIRWAFQKKNFFFDVNTLQFESHSECLGYMCYLGKTLIDIKIDILI